MKVQRIDFKDELPDRITVELTLAEAVSITSLIGNIPHTEMESVHSVEPRQVDSVYSGLTNWVFNPYWDDGVRDAQKDLP